MQDISRRRFGQLLLTFGTLSCGKAVATTDAWVRGEKLAISRTLRGLRSPVLLKGDSNTAYRDPAALYHDGWFYLFYTLVRTGADGIPYSFVAWSKSRQLSEWTRPVIITKKGRDLDYGSPGDIVRFGERWILCLQTYPRPNGEKFGNADSRIWTMSSSDLEHWEEPKLLRVGGPQVTRADMGRMIDPYLLRDRDEPKVWWCFYKHNGIRLSRSVDLEVWEPVGLVGSGENPCVIVDGDEYVLFYSPENGIGVKRSTNLKNWTDEGVLVLGQEDWPWAKGRITAGFVLDLRGHGDIGKALMFFHGSQFAEEDPRGGFDTFASLGIAWSSDLKTWHWPTGGKNFDQVALTTSPAKSGLQFFHSSERSL